MAITPTNLVNGHFPVNLSGSVNGASITPVAGKTHIATITTTSGTEDTTHSISGNGLTWTLKESVTASLSGGSGRLSVFQGTGTPSAGATTFSWTGTAQDAAWWSVTDFSEAPTIRNTASGTMVLVTSKTVTLPAFQDGNSLAVGFCYNQAAEITPGSGFTQLYEDDFAGAGEVNAEYKINDNTVDWSFDGSSLGMAAALELAAAGTTTAVGMVPLG